MSQRYNSLRLNYNCIGGQYGKILYISPGLAQNDHTTDVGGKTVTSDQHNVQETNAIIQEETKKRTEHLERIHKDTLQDKDVTIRNLRELILEHERKVLELESKTEGNSKFGTTPSSVLTHSSPTAKLLDQIDQLQREKEHLLYKLSEYESTNSTSYSSQFHGDFDEAVQMGSCTTDTEKELMLMKRDKHYLDQEIKKLKAENQKLRHILGKCGVVVSQVVSHEKHNGLISSPGDRTLIKSVHISSEGSVISLDQQLLLLKQELDYQINEIEKSDLKPDSQVSGGKLTHVQSSGKLGLEQEVYQLKEELRKKILDSDIVNTAFFQLKAAYVSLKEEVKDMPRNMGMLMSQVQKQIQQTLAEVNIKNKELVDKYLREMKLRKKLHNELVDLKGNIRVFCRIRPSIKEDGTEENDIVVSVDSNDDTLVAVNNNGKTQMFDVDKAFSMNSSQTQVFEEVSSLVRSVIDGYNVCIFAYGQTGSGKTFTMEGLQSDPGINQRALQLLFEETKSSEWQYEITASVMEIYNETMRDLLNVDTTNKLEIRMKPEGGLYVPGLENVTVTCLSDVNKLFDIGRRNRVTASTNMNEHSSRSHCLLRVTVTGLNATTGSKSLGYLNLVDLAGSERVSKSMAEGARLKEAQSINKSLACLGDVIHALRNKHGHVPYRNSKLTYLLQDSLGGDSKTLMIVQVSPVEKNVSETVCTLTFGQRVRNIELGTATRKVETVKSSLLTPGRPTSLSLSLPASPTTSEASTPQSSPRSPLSMSSSTPQLNTRKRVSSASQKLSTSGGRMYASSSLTSVRTTTTPSSSPPTTARRLTNLATKQEVTPTSKSNGYSMINKSNLASRLVKSASSPQNLSARIDRR
ncbi:kinesin-like protein KIFC3 [Biomphalaria pfeifferi]|uniref:Kinesin-like protein KIFC3 n=1 Tax=Biomphalaria pfeifferi TaxID=112525 RepID=A0AAD8B5S4_BIOPF|nr:kinesin-like protein KIFC3 [Biomphalaria pfeifferi]